RLFRMMGQRTEPTTPHDRLSDGTWVKEVFIKGAVNGALQDTAQDSHPAREGNVQTYLRELAVWDDEGVDPSKYRGMIAQLLLLPLYPRLPDNICTFQGRSRGEAAALPGKK